MRDPRPHEDDVDVDDAQALSRATGGVANSEHPDQASTTGTTPDGVYVGRPSYRSTPVRSSRTKVTASDRSRLGRQPMRFEKKKNMDAVCPRLCV